MKTIINSHKQYMSYIEYFVNKDTSYSSHLRFIKCEYLLPDEIKPFTMIMDSLDSEFIGSLWQSFQKRTNDSSTLPLNNRHRENLLLKEK